MRFKKKDPLFDRLEELKEEFRQWKKNQRKILTKYDDDHLEWYCYAIPVLIIIISIFILGFSFFLL